MFVAKECKARRIYWLRFESCTPHVFCDIRKAFLIFSKKVIASAMKNDLPHSRKNDKVFQQAKIT